MKSLKLKIDPGRIVTYCCTEILVDAERVESSGAFNPEHLRYITHIFEDTYDSISRRLRILSINFVCLKWMSYHHRRSSPMSPFYKSLSMNTIIFSIKSGGNRLPARRILKTNLHFERNTL